MDKVEARGLGFSEMQSYWTLPFHEFAVVGDVSVVKDSHNRPLKVKCNYYVIHLNIGLMFFFIHIKKSQYLLKIDKKNFEG